MARTHRGGKAPGFEFASERHPGWAAPGRYTKTRTHRIERQASKKLARFEERE